MARYILRRLAWLVVVLYGVASLSFLMIRMVPGDVVDILIQGDVGGSFVDLDKMRAYFGIDQPIHIQYVEWMKQLAQGDFGTSFRSGEPVMAEISSRATVTAELVFLSMLIAIVLGVPLGVLAAVRRNSWIDAILRPLSMLGLAIPSFWLGTLFLLLMSLYVPQVSVLGYVPFVDDPVSNLRVMAWPSLALGLVSAAAIMRMTRATMLEVLGHDYVRTARAKGLREGAVIHRHALRTALIPIVTLIGVEIGILIGGSIVLERVFALPGVGQLIITAIEQRDYPIVQGVALFVAAGFALINLATDVIYGYLDPRIRYE